jgi:hypothetical protein
MTAHHAYDRSFCRRQKEQNSLSARLVRRRMGRMSSYCGIITTSEKHRLYVWRNERYACWTPNDSSVPLYPPQDNSLSTPPAQTTPTSPQPSTPVSQQPSSVDPAASPSSEPHVPAVSSPDPAQRPIVDVTPSAASLVCLFV